MLRDLRLQHFRSYEDRTFIFKSGVTIIVGPNASGKTNLLEAILLIARGSSYRVHDQELLAYGHDWSRLDATTDNGKRTIKLQHNLRFEKTYEVDGRVLKRLSYQQIVPAVVFEPNHLFLLHGARDGRRDYLDSLLEQLQPGYSTLRRDYRRVLAQRNSLLKQGHQNIDNQIFAWNIRLSELGGRIFAARHKLIESINERSSHIYSNVAHADTVVRLEYTTALSVNNYESQLLHKLEQNIEKDIIRGFTGTGPHREDFSVLLSGHPMQTNASRGEVRTAVLMLKIVELELLAESRSQAPILLLDDVFSELDTARRAALTNYLMPYQTFITTTDADVVSQHFTAAQKISMTAPKN